MLFCSRFKINANFHSLKINDDDDDDHDDDNDDKPGKEDYDEEREKKKEICLVQHHFSILNVFLK